MLSDERSEKSQNDDVMQLRDELREARQAVYTLSHEQHEFKHLIDSVLDYAIFSIDADGIILNWNPGAERMKGWTKDEIVGRHYRELYLPEDREAKKPERNLALAEAHGHHEEEGWRQRKDGGKFWAHVSLTPMRDEQGRLIGFSKVTRDMTEARRAEDERRQAAAFKHQVETLQEVNRMKDQFLSILSHELRTPINAIMGFGSVLDDELLGPLTPEQHSYLGKMLNGADVLLALINDLLDVSRISAGKFSLEPQRMDLGRVITEALDSLLPLAEQKHQRLVPIVPADLPTLIADPQRVTQVLINIVNNAIKFSGGRPAMRGRVAVRAELAEATASQVWLSLRISDNGIGMDASTLAGLFTSFSQADVSTTRRFGGTGLGLAISHRLVDLMGGGITVQSVVGQGSTFVVRLPCTPLPQPLGVRGAFPIADLDCVVVSDAQEGAQDHADYLRSAGARVERVRDLAAAGAWTARHRPAMTVWVVDAGSSPLHPDTWRDVTRMKADMQLEVAAIGIDRTRRNGSGSTGQGMMLLDGNVLTRQRLLRAVAVVAGRMSEESFDAPAMVSSNALEAPSRDEAVRRKQLVLVVEDNETNQQVISRQLHLLGIAADVVGDGQAALQAWRSGDYSLIVTDLHMPVMDGYQLTRVIRAEEGRKRRIPIVALSANTVKEEAQRCLALGMNDYLSKPAQLSDLRRMLAKWLPAADIAALDTPTAVAHTAAQYPADRASEATLVRPPVDVHVLEALVGDNVAVVAGFLRDFRKTAQDIVREILAAADTGSASGMAAGAHKLKSSARAVGAMELGELCSELEHLALVGRLSEASEALMHLDTEMKRVVRYLDSR